MPATGRALTWTWDGQMRDARVEDTSGEVVAGVVAGAVFPGTGEMARRCRAFDWAATPLGPVAEWPPTLRAATRLVLDAPGAMSLYAGPEFVTLYNDAYRRVLGAKHPAALGRPAAAVWAELWAQIAPQYAQVRAGGPALELHDVPFTVARLDGGASEAAWFDYALSPVRDEGTGAVVAILSVVTETADRMRAEAALADERERLRALLLRLPTPVAVFDGPEHRFSLVNDAFRHIAGPRPDLVGRTAAEAFPELEGQGFFELLDQVYTTGVPWVGPETLTRYDRDGTGVQDAWFDTRFDPVRGDGADGVPGQVTGVLNVAVDVTDQVRVRRALEAANAHLQDQQGELELTNQQLQEQAAELEAQAEELQATAAELEAQAEAAEQARAALAESELQFRTLADAIPTLAWTATADGYIDWYNARWYAYTGTTPEQMAGWGWQRVHDPAALPDVLARWTASIASGDVFEMTFPLRGADGQFRRFLTRVTPVRDGEGHVTRWFGTNTDVEVERAARDAAEAANQAKSQFLANMSHELRTPLNAIGGYVQLLELELHGPVSDDQRTALARVQAAQRRLLALINDVLNYAKLESGRVEYDVEPVDVRSVVADVAPLVEPQATAKGLGLDLRLPDAPCLVWADREKLGQILLNLLANAIKFTEARHPVTGVPGRVTVQLAERAGRADTVFLRVSDTGRGIAREKQGAIFEPFVQVRTGYAQATEGTGLGLAISRDLARGMGGELRVRSAEGEGATFTVALRRVVTATGQATDRRTGAERRDDEDRRSEEDRRLDAVRGGDEPGPGDTE